ncbi:hypothetical protein HJFPF1_08752 [Paramyrothecium foliicola]|nr:hypothetical protein HJFPF1_08752 [Paramyrothecium foliicola]
MNSSIRKPDHQVFLNPRNRRPFLLVLRAALDQASEDGHFFLETPRGILEMLVRYLKSIVRTSDATEPSETGMEHEMEFLGRIGGCQSWTVQVGSQTHHVLTTRKRDELRIGASQQWQLSVALHQFWPRLMQIPTLEILPLVRIGPPNVPRPLMLLPTTTPNTPVGLLMEHIRPLSDKQLQKGVDDLHGFDTLGQLLSMPQWASTMFTLHFGEMQPRKSKWDFYNPSQIVVPYYYDALSRDVPSKMGHWAAKMGATLAVLHWGCDLDGAGVLWCFGRTLSGKTRVFATNVHLCRPFNRSMDGVVEQLVSAALSSPHWPRPKNSPWFRDIPFPGGDVLGLWKTFSTTYIDASKVVLASRRVSFADEVFPSRFIAQLEHAWAAAPSMNIDAEDLSD